MKGIKRETDSEDDPMIRNVINIINCMECPGPSTILELIGIRNNYTNLDVTSLMVKAYLLGAYDGSRSSH
jgi:hypothetical protein